MFGSLRRRESAAGQAASSPDLTAVFPLLGAAPFASRRKQSSGGFSEFGAKRKEKRSSSDGPLTTRPFRFPLSSPGLTVSDEHLRRTDLGVRGHTLPPSSTRVSAWPPSSPARSANQEEAGEECYRLRSFSVTSKGIVHVGDLLRRRSRSTVSLGSDGSSTTDTRDLRESSTTSSYRVLVVGNSAAGKSTLVSQFVTSETSVHFEDDEGSEHEHDRENAVSILLNGEESELSFLDSREECGEVDSDTFDEVDAVAVVYSIADRESFEVASRALQHLRRLNHETTRLSWDRPLKAVILVGNKADLVRSRVVSIEEGRNLANTFSSKFIETSGAIGHNVNELLVGILNQIRLHVRHAQLTAGDASPRSHSRLTAKARGLMHRLVSKYDDHTHSCDNLNVL